MNLFRVCSAAALGLFSLVSVVVRAPAQDVPAQNSGAQGSSAQSGGAASAAPQIVSLQNVPEPTPLARTVSIGDVIHAEDAAAVVTRTAATAINSKGRSEAVMSTTAPPIHLLYVHGIDQIGPNDSAMVRDAICRYLHECIVEKEPPLYAEGPFALTAPPPDLRYLQQPVWASAEEWHASAPYIQRYRISGGGHAPFVLDEINWYPLVYPLKCKFILPGDARLTGGVKGLEDVCRPTANQPDPNSPGHFLAYIWPGNVPLFTTDLPRQRATLINRELKAGVMDWGFGDAVLALGPMREILTGAIRQLLALSLVNVLPNTPSPAHAPRTRGLTPPPTTSDRVPTFFITHSLGSYLSLTAMDSAWLGANKPQIPGFAINTEQANAIDYLAFHTTGFYFFANQISLLEFGRLAPPSPLSQADCSVAATEAASATAEPAAAALSHYGCMRHNYLTTNPPAGPQSTDPQIIAWSAADDILSWYVPAITGVAVVNLPAHNAGFRIPGLVASPASAHSNYAKNPAVARVLFETTRR